MIERPAEILLASGNPKKLGEIRDLLARTGVRLITPDELGGLPEVEEDAPSFAGNAAKKARSAALFSGHWSLADDSGLEVRHLEGAPGVRSARYAGEPCDDGANNARLLRELEGVPDERRAARFVCALALARPDGEIALSTEAEAEGRILHEHRGDGDFGYDPLFLFTEAGYEQTGRSFAELSGPAKAEISHRGRALRALREQLARPTDPVDPPQAS